MAKTQKDNFVKDLIDMFDTQNTVDVSIISVGDCLGGQSGPTPQVNNEIYSFLTLSRLLDLKWKRLEIFESVFNSWIR